MERAAVKIAWLILGFAFLLVLSGCETVDSKRIDTGGGELSFVGEAYDKDPETAKERAKGEAFRKMIYSIAGVDISGESKNKVSYSNEFSNPVGVLEEKEQIDFYNAVTITPAKLKGLTIRTENSYVKEGDLYHATFCVFINKDEARKARMQRELDRVLLEAAKDDRETEVRFPQKAGDLLERARSMLAESFVSSIGKQKNINRIAVLDIAGDSNGFLREEIISCLFQMEEYEVIERHAVLQEQKLGLSEIVDPGSAVAPGKILGIDAVIYGKVKRAEENDGSASAEAYLKMVAVESGKIVWAGVIEGHSEN